MCRLSRVNLHPESSLDIRGDARLLKSLKASLRENEGYEIAMVAFHIG